MMDITKKFEQSLAFHLKKLDQKHLVEGACPFCEQGNFKMGSHDQGMQLHSCDLCDGQFLSPRPEMSTMKMALQGVEESPLYWRLMKEKDSWESEKQRLWPLLTTVLAKLKTKKKKINSICDVGAGSGHMLKLLKSEFEAQEAVAIDQSCKASLLCYENGLLALPVCVEEATLMHEKFDLVTCIDTLYYAANPRAFIQGLARLLRSKGTLLLTFADTRAADFEARLNQPSVAAVKKILSDLKFKKVLHSYQKGQDTHLIWATNS